MVYKRTRLGPSLDEQNAMCQDTTEASVLWESYYGAWGAPGQGYVSNNKFMPTTSSIDLVAMPVLLFGVALFFLLQ